ncbi:MAG: RlmE family RNA methyltransferase [Candidatus Peribacteraceae bacterium]|jgi:23S rRNA (uridine2552-2'-O)-methyltransferase|nr:RlmE family RNA methyltransferase [Candidatus Peribacteraceae bacterium]MDP7477602.1 RlmE family RNA methyltransferase [Candidatus Peribacteraceae bacterium]
MPKRYVPNDAWSQKAAAEGYRARSVYKLQEMDEKFRLIKPKMTILDLGAMPGSWSQYAAKKLKGTGRVIAVDLQEMEPIEGVETHTLDITDEKAMDQILPEAVDLIISDLAPKTSGIKDIDQWKSIELSEAVVEIAQVRLKSGGKCVIKVLRGGDFDEFLKTCKQEWKEVKTFSAKASRDRSKEIYVILRK